MLITALPKKLIRVGARTKSIPRVQWPTAARGAFDGGPVNGEAGSCTSGGLHEQESIADALQTSVQGGLSWEKWGSVAAICTLSTVAFGRSATP